MTFPFPIMKSRGAAIAYNVDNDRNATTLSTYTFTTKQIGGAAANRLVVVGFSGINVTANRTVSSITVAGSSATAVNFQQVSSGGVFVDVGLYAIRLDAGATGTIVVNWSAAQLRTAIGVWAAYSVESATATATAQSSANPMSAGLTIQPGGICIGYASSFGGSTPTYTWSNLTEGFDRDYDAVATNSSYTGGQTQSPTAATPTIVATPSAFTAGYMVLAAFR